MLKSQMVPGYEQTEREQEWLHYVKTQCCQINLRSAFYNTLQLRILRRFSCGAKNRGGGLPDAYKICLPKLVKRRTWAKVPFISIYFMRKRFRTTKNLEMCPSPGLVMIEDVHLLRRMQWECWIPPAKLSNSDTCWCQTLTVSAAGTVIELGKRQNKAKSFRNPQCYNIALMRYGLAEFVTLELWARHQQHALANRCPRQAFRCAAFEFAFAFAWGSNWTDKQDNNQWRTQRRKVTKTYVGFIHRTCCRQKMRCFVKSCSGCRPVGHASSRTSPIFVQQRRRF